LLIISQLVSIVEEVMKLESARWVVRWGNEKWCDRSRRL